MINLIKNAFKFTEVGGSITIKMSYIESTDMLCGQVHDTGVGIPANEIEKLFSRFGKLHRTAKMNNEGIGLGLIIVKQIVEASQGEISVYSEGQGKGSVFSFSMKMPITNEDKANASYNQISFQHKNDSQNSLLQANVSRNPGALKPLSHS